MNEFHRFPVGRIRPVEIVAAEHIDKLSWSYVLNKASQNKEAAVKFLQYMASEEGMKASYEAFDRYPGLPYFPSLNFGFICSYLSAI